MTKSFGLFAAIVAAMVGVTDLALAQADAGSAAQSPSTCSPAQVVSIQAQAAAASAAERTALLARLADCEARATAAEQNLEGCVASRDTALDVIARRCRPTDEQVRDLCPDLCARGGGGQMGACRNGSAPRRDGTCADGSTPDASRCGCIEGYRHPSARRGRTEAMAACMCVNAAPSPPRDREPRPEPRRESAACPVGATDFQGRSIAGRPAPEGDRDCDGYLDDTDNCSYVPNRDQVDTDLDGLGDACDIDDHSDRIYLEWIETALRRLCTEGHTDYPVCIELQRLRDQEVSFQVTAEAVRVAMRDICRDPSTDDEIFICHELRELRGMVEDLREDVDAIENRWLGRVTLGVGTYTLGNFGGGPTAEIEGQLGYFFHPLVGLRGHLFAGLDVLGDGRHAAIVGGGGGFEFLPYVSDSLVLSIGAGIFGARGVIIMDGDPGALNYWGGYAEIGLTLGPGRGFHVSGRLLLGRYETDVTYPDVLPAAQIRLGWEF